eukprot:gene29796-33635_t
MKASPLLRAWLKRLEGMGVTILTRHRWTGFDGETLLLETPDGQKCVVADATLLALGGASWPKLGSDAAWVPLLEAQGIEINPLRPANCGFDCDFSESFDTRFSGQPVKSVKATSAAGTTQGEFVISRGGIEGSLIYAHSAALRDALDRDGQVALILDVGGIARVRALTPTEFTDTAAVSADVGSQALLVLEVSNGRRAALPLTAVSRLEEFDSSRIERSGSSEVVQYRDGILRLLRLAPAIGLQDTPGEREQISVVVHEENGHRVGIVIDQVLDVVDEAIVATEVGRRSGVLGSAVVQDRVTDLVDLDAVVRPLELIS